LSDQIRERTAWLKHLRGCPECAPWQLCATGHERLDAVIQGMSPEESLPEWLARLAEEVS
jgi:hypothetical protein